MSAPSEDGPAAAPDAASASGRAPRARRPLTPGRLLAFTGFTLFFFVVLIELSLQGLAFLQGPQTRMPTDGSLDPPDPGAFRVIAIGDSWVFGAESEPDEAFIEVFRRLASKKLDAPVQIYNLGVSASNSSQALVALHSLIEPVQPDLVVALTGANNGLHDRGVAEAARILGEDARTVPGLSALASLRTVRLARLIYVNLVAPQHIETTTRATATLPPPPEPWTSAIVRLPWWDLFTARRWEDALALVQSTAPPDDSPANRGLQTAWEALLLAHLERHSAATAAAKEALSLGGDDTTAYEALAVVADSERRGLDALHFRARAALAPGNPVLRERARGLVLLELESWEHARVWLLSAGRAMPGNLEILLGLAQLPPTVRTDEVDQCLFDGPRGLVAPWEFMRWHLASSGMADRAVASLGDEDPDESFHLRAARAEAAALTGDAAAARAGYEELIAELETNPEALPHHLDIARGGAYLHGAPAVSDDETPWGALGLMVAHDRVGDCGQSVAAAQRALDAGIAPSELERRAGPCLPRNTSWTLREMVVERARPLDVRALVAQETPPGPQVLGWSVFRERRFAELPSTTPAAWRALARAFADAPEEPTSDVEADPAVAALARAWRHLRAGREKESLVHFAAAVETPGGEPWVQHLAWGWGATLAHDWVVAQSHLHAAETLAPRQLESLDAFVRIPEAVRTRATREAVDRAPVGRIPASRWIEWHLQRGQVDRAELAARWSWAPLETPVAEQLSAVRASMSERRAARDAEPDPRSGPSSLAADWLAGHADPGRGLGGGRTDDDPLVQHLDAMNRLAASQGATFVALTYPFPSGHHSEVREIVLQGGSAKDYATLDLYGSFASAYSPADWEALRTPEDHVNANGYAHMGRLLTTWATTQGLLPSDDRD